jgi:hypothetical protein
MVAYWNLYNHNLIWIENIAEVNGKTACLYFI